MLDIIIRPEERADAAVIRAVITAAFQDQPHSSQNEHHIVDKLRDSGALEVSLVAVSEAAIVGHIAFSPVTIDGRFCAWYGLGPLSVAPIHQRKGVGSRLVNAGLNLLDARSANGCVLLGEADFYSRFGFIVRDGLGLDGFPPEYFLARPFVSHCPRGEVGYHVAFSS